MSVERLNHEDVFPCLHCEEGKICQHAEANISCAQRLGSLLTVLSWFGRTGKERIQGRNRPARPRRRKEYGSTVSNGNKSAESIVVNGRFFSQPVTGVQRYAVELLRSLDQLLSTGALEPLPVTVLVPPNAAKLPSYSFIKIKQAGRLTGHLWEQCELPLFAHGRLLFTPCGGAPVLYKRNVITIHDAGPFSTPDAFTWFYRNYYKAMQRHLARTAKHILTVSKFSKGELMTALGVADEAISYAYPSGEAFLRWDTDPSVLTRNGLKRGSYILAVGSRNPNKNLAGLVKAFSLLPRTDIQIAIAGGTNPHIFGNSRFPTDSVKLLGFVKDSELRTLYENAACFVFPSFYEGFGSPPLEALTLGCPVLVSDKASLPEVCGGAAVYCDPYDPHDIADKIMRILQGERPSLEFRLAHAARFRWSECAQETWKILSKASRGES